MLSGTTLILENADIDAKFRECKCGAELGQFKLRNFTLMDMSFNFVIVTSLS